MGNHLIAYNQQNKEHSVQDNSNTNEQISIPMPEPGEYRIDIVGADIPVGPQAWALAISGPFEVLDQCSEARQCPRNCSDVGRCEDGECKCPLSRRGVGCELLNVELERNKQVTDMISSGGWSYYYFSVEPGQAWQ
eukprot:2240447-Rhodomonas_salina.1